MWGQLSGATFETRETRWPTSTKQCLKSLWTLTAHVKTASYRNLPPQFSRLKRLLKLWLTNGEMLFRSWVRTLVASSDWWASLKVVSISSSPWWARTALANPSGPSRSSTSRKPTGGSPNGERRGKKRKRKSMIRIFQNNKEVEKIRQQSFAIVAYWLKTWMIYTSDEKQAGRLMLFIGFSQKLYY